MNNKFGKLTATISTFFDMRNAGQFAAWSGDHTEHLGKEAFEESIQASKDRYKSVNRTYPCPHIHDFNTKQKKDGH